MARLRWMSFGCVLYLGPGACIAASAPTVINLPRQDCRTILPRSDGGCWVLGVENTGDTKLTDTRQRIVLGEITGSAYREVAAISDPGFVYFPTVAMANGTLWIVWDEWRDGEWRIMARCWMRSDPGKPEVISDNQGPALWPAMAAVGDKVVCAWSAAGNRDLDIWTAEWRGKWGRPERVTGDGYDEMRPALAVTPSGALWLAYDYYSDKGMYRVAMQQQTSGGWAKPVQMMQMHQSPRLYTAADGVVWATTPDGQVVGFKDGIRYWPEADITKALGKAAARHVVCDDTGRPWAFAFHGGRRVKSECRFGAIVGGSVQDIRQVPGDWSSYQPPVVAGGKVYLVSDPAIATGQARLCVIDVVSPVGEPAALRDVGILGEPRPPVPPEVTGFRPTLSNDGSPFTVYFGELHTHLGEMPRDVEIRDWTDRYYLDARYTKRLDIASISDHDWPSMTQTKYLVEQAIAQALSAPDQFVGLNGFEWSGDGATRLAFGDRTVVFPPGYFIPPRITDPQSNTPQKMHETLRKYGAIDWPHHVGSPWAIMDWTSFQPDVEPVVEITSSHGVFETYDPAHAVPVELLHGRAPAKSHEDPNVDKTSIQYGLSQGYEFGFVGSSDSHSGFSGYQTGMLALLAPKLTPADVFAAWRARRVYAIRGGERIRLSFSCGNTFMGGEATQQGEPLLHVAVTGTNPITRVEIVRDNRYIHATEPNRPDVSFDYRDTSVEPGKRCYYIRVWQQADSYAWSSPIWVTVT